MRCFDEASRWSLHRSIPPQELYRDGLQRSRFLPAIALLEQHSDWTHLEAATDYRFRTLQRADLWHVPTTGPPLRRCQRIFVADRTGAGDPRSVDIKPKSL